MDDEILAEFSYVPIGSKMTITKEKLIGKQTRFALVGLKGEIAIKDIQEIEFKKGFLISFHPHMIIKYISKGEKIEEVKIIFDNMSRFLPGQKRPYEIFQLIENLVRENKSNK
jgi:hypothetical protein